MHTLRPGDHDRFFEFRSEKRATSEDNPFLVKNILFSNEVTFSTAICGLM